MTVDDTPAMTQVVFYRWWDNHAGTQGTGRTEVHGPITCLDDVAAIEDQLAGTFDWTYVVVTGWQPFDQPAPTP